MEDIRATGDPSLSFNPILTRVLVHDPNPLLATSIRSGLELTGPFTTEACSGDLSEVLIAFRPNIVVLDPAHLPAPPETYVTEVTRRLPNCEVLAYVTESGRRAAQQCLAAGFVGAVSHGRGIEGLVEALTVARLGGIYVDQCFAPSASSSPEAGRGEGSLRLSDRERFVLEHVARGFSNKEIAGKLGLSAKTVETYRSRASGKLGLRRKSDIVQHALRCDWLGERPDRL